MPSPALKRLSTVLPASPTDLSRLRRRLAAAGYHDVQRRRLVFDSQADLADRARHRAAVACLGFRSGWLAGLACAVLGFIIPDLVLTQKIAQHRKAIQDGLPDALDLIVVCVEAGSSLDQAIVKASNELEIALPSIARELKTVATEIRAGKPRHGGVSEPRDNELVSTTSGRWSAMLIQTDRFGTSVAQSLRTHADTSRSKRRQRAEQRASTIGVKLVFPLVLCLMPALYVVCLGPVVVNIYQEPSLGTTERRRTVLDTTTTASLAVLVVFVVLYVLRRKSRLDREANGEN